MKILFRLTKECIANKGNCKAKNQRNRVYNEGSRAKSEGAEDINTEPEVAPETTVLHNLALVVITPLVICQDVRNGLTVESKLAVLSSSANTDKHAI